MKIIFITTVLFLAALLIHGQKTEEPVIKKTNNDIVKYVKFPPLSQNGTSSYTVPVDAGEFFVKYLITNKENFRKVPHKSKNKKFIHEHYDQYYKGIKVDGGGYNFHYEKGRMYLAHGHYVKIGKLDITPAIGAERAKQIFAVYKNIPLDIVIGFKSELMIKEIPSSNENDTLSVPKLVYRIYLLLDHPENDETGFIDAHTGKVLFTEPNMTGFSATGTFATRYQGSRQGVTQYYNNTYNLCDSTRGAIIHTWNINGATNITNRVELTDNDNNWTAAEHAPNEDDMGLDIHWGLQQIYDHLYNRYDINSFDDDGEEIHAHIHYGTDDEDRDNACWFMEEDVLAFGDGAVIFSPVACLDAVGHEYGHGITDFQIGWAYSGDLKIFHEGLSDIWGAIFEYRIAPISVWEIGEQIDLDFDCLRNIQNTNDPDSRVKISDTYLSSQYNSGNHYVKGGVFSHWFYLLVNGGSGVNDLGNSYNIYGIGMDATEDIIIESVFENYLDNTNSYPDIRDQIVTATEALYGQNSLAVMQVENAWWAVGVGTEPIQMSITGSTLVCTSNSTFTLHNRPPGATVSWEKGPSLNYVSGQGTNNYTVNAYSSAEYPSWVRATISSNCGNTEVQKDVWAGKPSFSSFQLLDANTGYPLYELCRGEYNYIEVEYTGSSLAGVDNNWDWQSSEFNIDFPIYPDKSIGLIHPFGSYGTIYMKAHNQCGYSYQNNFFLSVIDCGGWFFGMHPNPADDYVDITATKNDKAENVSEYYEVKIYNSLKVVVYGSEKTKEPLLRINTRNLMNGVYFIHFIAGEKSEVKQLVVNH